MFLTHFLHAAGIIEVIEQAGDGPAMNRVDEVRSDFLKRGQDEPPVA